MLLTIKHYFILSNLSYLSSSTFLFVKKNNIQNERNRLVNFTLNFYLILYSIKYRCYFKI